MLSVVTKQFRSDRPHEIGEIVDTSGWRLERQLREQHYIRPASEDEIQAAVAEVTSAPARQAPAKASRRKR